MKNAMTIAEIRRANLQLLIDEFKSSKEAEDEPTVRAFAKKCDTSNSYLSQILTQMKTAKGVQRMMGDELARKIEHARGKPTGWMDQRHDNIDPAKDELVSLFESMDESGRALLLQQGRMILKIGK